MVLTFISGNQVTIEMNLEGLIFSVSVIFCLALTAGGILVIFRFAKLRQLPAFQHMQYYLILLYTFGYYALWSGVFISFIPPAQHLQPFSEVLDMMGIPFIVFSTSQQMYWCKHLVVRKLHWTLIPIVVLTSGVAAFIFFNQSIHVYALFGAASSAFCLLLLSIQKSSFLTTRDQWVLAAACLLLLAFYACQHFIKETDVESQSANNFLFFLLNTFLCVFFVYRVKFDGPEKAAPPSMDAFIKKFGLTSRESEIVGEIYSGKTNQQIADTLFVTLQTVKDHTSRIYLKADVKSRAQLITLMRDFV